jgi:hypothetical protein
MAYSPGKRLMEKDWWKKDWKICSFIPSGLTSGIWEMPTGFYPLESGLPLFKYPL